MTFSPEYEKHAAEYLATCELDAKNNPRFTDGMWVKVFNPYGQYVGVGEVVRSEWNEHACRHFHDVYIFDADYTTYSVRDDRMERYVMSLALSRQYKKSLSTPWRA